MEQEQQREEFLIRDRVTGQPRPYYVAADNINLGDDENYQSLPDTLKEMQDDIDAASGGGGVEGTVTAVKMNNGTPIKPNNDGVVDLGTVITSHQSLAALFGRVAYDGTTHRINFYGKDDVSMTTVLGYIDCSPFIVDGMLSNVEVKNVTINNVSTPCIVFSFNTDAGKQNINIPVSSIFNAANYYTKDDADGRFQLKLVSGTNIKTVNNTSILGEGNINVSAGADGVTPHIGANGNWWVGPETDSNNDTGIKAQGHKGDKGDTVVVGDEEEFTIVNDLTTGGESDALSAEMGKRLALLAGTYAGAWARSKAVIVPFCWLWTETVGGAAISKPIWHIGNSVFIDSAGGVVSVQASAIPATPTFSETSGSTVGKGTELTITPDTDSALYYKIGNGAWIVSDVAVTIEITATTTITAKCVNNAGSSSEVQCALTVSGPQAPSFAAAQGTTIASGDVVSRGGSVVVSVPQGGELHYSTDGTNYTTASGLSVTIPVPAAGVHIYAYNVQDNDQSAVVDHNYTMAALAAPSISPANNTEFPAGGGTATITASEGDGIRYTTDGSDPRTSNTATVVNALTASVAVSSAVTIKACAFDDYGKSDLVQATYSVAVDHKFQFKIKLTGDNSTEYIPVTGNNGPQYHFTVDWGDNTQETIGAEGAPVGKANKSVGHQYSGTAGTEFTITLRGTSIPVLVFNNAITGCCNIGALSAIVDNTLDCDTNFYGGFAACTGLESICANALQNNTNGYVSFRGTALTSVPDGLLSHLTKSGVNLTSCFRLFQDAHIVFTASQVAELVGAITHVTNFEAMFYGFSGTFAFPDDFFDGISADTITTLENMTHTAGTHVSGDAKKLYDSLVSRVKSNATTTRAFNATGLSNRSQVPTTWGGSMS